MNPVECVVLDRLDFAELFMSNCEPKIASSMHDLTCTFQRIRGSAHSPSNPVRKMSEKIVPQIMTGKHYS